MSYLVPRGGSARRLTILAVASPGGSAGVDPLGYYLPPFAYSYMQVLQAAVEGTKGLDQDKLADYLRSHEFSTIMAASIRFFLNASSFTILG